jgi:hypothetical protein
MRVLDTLPMDQATLNAAVTCIRHMGVQGKDSSRKKPTSLATTPECIQLFMKTNKHQE